VLTVTVAVLLTGLLEPEEADEEAIALAHGAYQRAVDESVDMSRGTCLGVIKEGWVADVAHDLRQPVDDEPANQCEEYRSGDADHFVELDPKGRYMKSGGRRFFGLFRRLCDQIATTRSTQSSCLG
jgi:hypothetical protein